MNFLNNKKNPPYYTMTVKKKKNMRTDANKIAN